MPHIVTVFSLKGGTGKTTLSLALYDVFANSAPTVLVEADAQNSLAHLDQVSGLGLNLAPFTTLEAIQAMPEAVAVVDCPPVPFDGLPSLLAQSSFVLVPTRAGYTDLLALRATVAMIETSGARAGIVFNALKAGTKLNSELAELAKGYGLPVLKTSIGDRVAYAKAAHVGTVYGQGDAKAEAEISSLVNEIYSKLVIR